VPKIEAALVKLSTIQLGLTQIKFNDAPTMMLVLLAAS
jgi:hypothetical protein